jgi:hypothetical protein
MAYRVFVSHGWSDLWVAQIGFWDTFVAVLGAVAMIVLFIVLGVAVVVVGLLAFAHKLFR